MLLQPMANEKSYVYFIFMLSEIGVRSGFFFRFWRIEGLGRYFIFGRCEKGCGGNIFFSAATNMRGAGVPGAGGRCLRNYKLTLRGLMFKCIFQNHVSLDTILALI